MAKVKQNKEDVKSEIVSKLYLVYVFVLFIGVVILLQILYLQIFKKDELAEKAATTKDEIVDPNRGDICDVNGRTLATSIPYYKISMDTKVQKDSVFIKNVDSLAICLANLFQDRTAAEYLKLIKQGRKEKNQYLHLQDNVTYSELKQLKTFPIFKKGRYKGGLIYDKQTFRILPHYMLAERTIGYVNETGKKIGIEGAFNTELKGKFGYRLVQKMSGGSWRPIKFDNEIEPEDGQDIITTIDINIQDLVETSLRKQLLKNKAQWGTAILMDVKTGEIRAIANLGRQNDSTYIEDYNYGIGMLYEPGSTFKLASIIAALEKGNVELDDIVDTKNGVLQIGDFVLRDSQKGGYGKITVQQAFELSSNIGVSGIVYEQFKKDPEEFFDRLYNMGLNERLDINDVEGEKEPEIKYPGEEFWSGVSLRQMSIGYELKITPIQLLAFYNAVANDGVMLKPIFVKGIRQYGEIIQEFKSEIINNAICSKKTLEKARLLLEGVVKEGTATNLQCSSFNIAGKTGTAQIALNSGGYTTETGKNYNASFVGYFPAENPKYSCIVVINSPKEVSFYGGQAAGPIFKEIAEKLYATDYDMQIEKEFDLDNFDEIKSTPISKSGYSDFLDVVYDKLNIEVSNSKDVKNDWVKVTTNANKIQFSSIKLEKGIVPNVVGMGASDAVYLLENRGLKVIVEGRGTVTNQSLESGAVIEKGQSITIKLS